MRIIKKVSLWLLLVVVLVCTIVGGTLGWFYFNTDETAVALPAVAIGETTLAASSFDWNTPVLSGALYKPYHQAQTSSVHALGTIATAQVPIILPEDALTNVTVYDAQGHTVIDSNDASLQTLDFTANGAYTCSITVNVPQRAKKGYGTFYYDVSFTLAVEPKIEFSQTQIEQGGVVCILVSGMMDESIQPEVETELSLTCFTDTPKGKAAFIGLHYNREPGDYTVTVRYGELVSEQVITVIHRDFEKQYMTIDTSVSAETNDSAEANAEWRDTIWPLYETADSQTYWSGLFVRPTDSSEINTSYGIFRYTNGSSYAERHAGIDLDGNEGDPVRAAARGKVVYAGFLKLTGNTVVIEHGAGLKTYYFHMASLSCEKDAIVDKSQQIGTIGSTGYSTGPHLHFDARIGNQSIDPIQLLRGSSGIYFVQ